MTKDNNLAKKVCGPRIRGLKGKSARTKPVPAVDNVAEILDELINASKELKLSVDGLSVDDLNL